MNIIVLMGSPNESGSTSQLVKSFDQGATEAGHHVTVVNCDRASVAPCTGCIACGYNGPCVQKDDMEAIRPAILGADMLVFATPLYYYGMSAQLKIIVDRFCSFNSSLQRKRLKSALHTVAWNSDDWTFDALAAHYKTFVRYLNLNDQGMVLGYGCGTPSMTRASRCPKAAYELGRSL